MTMNATSNADYQSALYSIWSVQDALLQGYRSMFLTAESLLIAVAAAIAATPERDFVWPLFWLGLAVGGVWTTVTRKRARDVRFIQDLILAAEHGQYVLEPFNTFKAYQKSWLLNRSYSIPYQGAESVAFNPPGVWPPRDVAIYKFWSWGTRIHMEVTIPMGYLVGWLIIGQYAVRA